MSRSRVAVELSAALFAATLMIWSTVPGGNAVARPPVARPLPAPPAHQSSLLDLMIPEPLSEPELPENPEREDREDREDSDDGDDAARIDLYGNEVTAALAKYRLDERGGLYELHSPATKIPKLTTPKI